MAQQQLLLVTLCTVVVGGLTLLGLAHFESSQVQQDREAALKEAITLTAELQQWKRTPTPVGGGKAYVGFYGVGFPALGYEVNPLAPSTYQKGQACFQLTTERPAFDAQLDVWVGGCHGQQVLTVTLTGATPGETTWTFH